MTPPAEVRSFISCFIESVLNGPNPSCVIESLTRLAGVLVIDGTLSEARAPSRFSISSSRSAQRAQQQQNQRSRVHFQHQISRGGSCRDMRVAGGGKGSIKKKRKFLDSGGEVFFFFFLERARLGAAD